MFIIRTLGHALVHFAAFSGEPLFMEVVREPKVNQALLLVTFLFFFSTMGHLSGTMGHLPCTREHFPGYMVHLPSTMGHLHGSMGHLPGTIGHLPVTMGSFS